MIGLTSNYVTQIEKRTVLFQKRNTEGEDENCLKTDQAIEVEVLCMDFVVEHQLPIWQR